MQLKKKYLNRKNWRWIVNYGLIISLFISESCKNKTPITSKDEKGVIVDLPSDFIDFYEKFHKDSAYQMAHITFPLEGYPSRADSSVLENGGYRWQKETWQMHRMAFLSDSFFTRRFEHPIPELVNEVVKQNNTPLGIFRRFYKRGNDWYLIFYSDMNPIPEN